MTFAHSVNATIASGAATSAAVDIRGKSVGGIYTPAEFDGTSITFTVCDTEAGTYVALTDPDTGSSVSIVAAASKFYAIDPVLTQAVDFIKFVASTNQTTTDTVLRVKTRAV